MQCPPLLNHKIPTFPNHSFHITSAISFESNLFCDERVPNKPFSTQNIWYSSKASLKDFWPELLLLSIECKRR